jgi:hypothetical protein
MTSTKIAVKEFGTISLVANGQGRIILGTEPEGGQTCCPVSLSLQEAQELRTALSNMIQFESNSTRS